MNDLRTAAQQAVDYWEQVAWGDAVMVDKMDALRAALAQQAEPVEPVAYIHRQGNHWEVSERHLDEDEKARGWTEEPLYTAPPQQSEPVEPWSTRERFYEAVDRAVEAVRQEMKIKTVTMRLPEYDITLPIIDAYSGHVVVGPVVPASPQRKPLTDEEIDAEWRKAASEEGFTTVQFVRNFARAIERAHGIGEEK